VTVRPVPVDVPWLYLMLRCQRAAPEVRALLYWPDDSRGWPANDRRYGGLS